MIKAPWKLSLERFSTEIKSPNAYIALGLSHVDYTVYLHD